MSLSISVASPLQVPCRFAAFDFLKWYAATHPPHKPLIIIILPKDDQLHQHLVSLSMFPTIMLAAMDAFRAIPHMKAIVYRQD